jgi:hypothetical protein
MVPRAWGAEQSQMLLGHLAQEHPDRVGHYLDQMRGREDIGEMAAQAYEVVEHVGLGC